MSVHFVNEIIAVAIVDEGVGVRCDQDSDGVGLLDIDCSLETETLMVPLELVVTEKSAVIEF